MEKILAKMFPPKLPEMGVDEDFDPTCIAHNDPTAMPVVEDGVTMVAYDVRKTGIEKMHEGLTK